MVLKLCASRRALFLATIGFLVGHGAAPAAAQSSSADESRFYELPADYQPIGLNLGKVRVYPELNLLLEHDSNIYALPENEKDDRIFYLIPRIRAELDSGTWQFRGLARAQLRRFVEFESENSTSGIVEGFARWSPREGETVRALASWQRVVEDRGDPEANDVPDRGPRRLNLIRSELGYRRDSGTWLLGVSGQANRIDYLADADADRDHNSYAGQASLGRQVGGLTFATLTVFAINRDFDQVDLLGVDRDATTYGARGGIVINPGGIVFGEASVGVFRFDPADDVIDSYTGMSLSGNISYRPTQRTTLHLEAFRGNVATYRAGAVARTDTRVQLTAQQEIRHNLYGRAAVFTRNTDYRGNRESQRTIGTEGELEYFINRNVGVTFGARYARRSSDNEFEEFTRFRALAGVRLYY